MTEAGWSHRVSVSPGQGDPCGSCGCNCGVPLVPVDVTVCSHGIRLQPRAEPAGVRAGRARVLHAEGDPQPAAASPRHSQEIPAETDPLLRLRDRAGRGFLRQRYLEGGREGWGIPAPRVLPRVGEVFLGAFPAALSPLPLAQTLKTQRITTSPRPAPPPGTRRPRSPTSTSPAPTCPTTRASPRTCP